MTPLQFRLSLFLGALALVYACRSLLEANASNSSSDKGLKPALAAVHP